MERVCRTCISSETPVRSLFEADSDLIEFHIKLYSCYPTLNFDDSDFPTTLCALCIEKLQNAYEFRQLCIKSSCALLEKRNIKNTINREIESVTTQKRKENKQTVIIQMSPTINDTIESENISPETISVNIVNKKNFENIPTETNLNTTDCPVLNNIEDIIQVQTNENSFIINDLNNFEKILKHKKIIQNELECLKKSSTIQNNGFNLYQIDIVDNNKCELNCINSDLNVGYLKNSEISNDEDSTSESSIVNEETNQLIKPANNLNHKEIEYIEKLSQHQEEIEFIVSSTLGEDDNLISSTSNFEQENFDEIVANYEEIKNNNSTEVEDSTILENELTNHLITLVPITKLMSDDNVKNNESEVALVNDLYDFGTHNDHNYSKKPYGDINDETIEKFIENINEIILSKSEKNNVIPGEVQNKKRMNVERQLSVEKNKISEKPALIEKNKFIENNNVLAEVINNKTTLVSKIRKNKTKFQKHKSNAGIVELHPVQHTEEEIPIKKLKIDNIPKNQEFPIDITSKKINQIENEKKSVLPYALCHMRTKSIENLKMHTKIHKKHEKKVECPYCHKLYRNNAHYIAHIGSNIHKKHIFFEQTPYPGILKIVYS